MIIEDIGVLEYLISRDPEAVLHVPAITALWQKLRKPRVERIKAYAKQNTTAFLNSSPLQDSKSTQQHKRDVQPRSMRHVTPDMNAKFDSRAFVKWTLDYDAVGEVSEGNQC